MASWMVHLRIANELLKTWDQLDETAFVMGNIAPDSGVPNENWTAYHPPKQVSHYKTKPEDETFFDLEVFCKQYFTENLIKHYSLKEYSFFLGYYVHLLTDIEWTNTVYTDLLDSHPKECAENKHGLIWAAKGDWYDLDFLYLEEHPDFRAFHVYENAVDFDNIFMDMFQRDAFENRRQYICWFYHSDQHGDLHRQYHYLAPQQADAFVERTVCRIRENPALSKVSSKYCEN
ncbi:MAG: zinc dependent phospholipase C family protein [Lachnospiraceae bacterium]|nr:zinc dependent phospholipase C family protein [Lachnospiraceae bacterium]